VNVNSQHAKTQNLGYPEPPAPDKQNLVRVAKGGGITLFGKIVTNIGRFVFAFLMARLLGAEQYGMYQLSLNAVTLLAGITVLGFDGALLRFIAIYVNRDDRERTWGTIQLGIGLPLILGSLTSIALFAFSYQVAVSVFDDIRMAPLLQISSVIVPFSILGSTLIGAVRGFKNMEYPVIAKFILQPIVKVVLIGIAAFFGLQVIHAVVIFGIGELLTAVTLIYYLNKLFPLKMSILSGRVDFKAVWKFTIPDWLAGLMDTFRGNIQTLLIGSLGSIAGVGIFTVANQLNILGHDFYSSINIAAKPYIAELHDKNEKSQLESIYQTSAKWSVLVNMPVFLAMVLFPTQILSIFGESFENGALALVIMACVNLVDVGTGMGGAILNMTGYTRLKLLNNIVSVVVSIALNVLLIPRFGVVGAAISALAVMSTVNALRIFQVYYLLKLIPYNRTFLKPIIAGLVTGILSYSLSRIYPIDAFILHLIVHVSVLFAVFAVMILLLKLDDDDRLMLNQITQKSQSLFQRFRKNKIR